MLITPNLFNLQRILHILAATQEVPQHNRLLSRGSMRVPPTSRGAPFPPHSSRGGILSLRARERIPGVSVATQEEALSRGKARETPGSCHHFQSPPNVSVHSRETCFPFTSSNCCFLTCIQISQEAGQVVWYSHLVQNFPQFFVIHTVKGFGIVNKAEIDVFSGTLLPFP